MPNFQQQNTFHFMFDRIREPLTIQPYLGKSDDSLGLGKPEYGTPIKVVEPITTTSNPAITHQQGSGGEMEISVLVWSSRTAGYKKGTLVTRDSTGETYTVTDSAPLTHSQLTYYMLQRNGGDENEPNGDGSTGGSADQVSNEPGGEDPLGV